MKRVLAAGIVLTSASWAAGYTGGGEEPSVAIASDACALLQEEVLADGT